MSGAKYTLYTNINPAAHTAGCTAQSALCATQTVIVQLAKIVAAPWKYLTASYTHTIYVSSLALSLIDLENLKPFVLRFVQNTK